MPLYEYRCRTCGTSFEQLRSIGDADAQCACPAGHRNAVRLLSLVARSATAAGGVPPAAPGGGCCGGGCCA